MAVSLDDIRAAHDRIRPHIHETPLLTSAQLNRLCEAEIFFKSEHLQKAGSFKTRGATNAVFSLAPGEAARGVATHSSGNHGSALARAAQRRGIPAHIVVPRNAARVKQAAIVGYGGEITTCEPTLGAREAALADVVARTGAVFIPPYDDNRIIAGQGTAVLEAAAALGQFDVCVTPVGGGGLLAGSAIACRHQRAEIYGDEPAGADDAFRSLASGERVTRHEPHTIADGLLTTLGERNFAIIAGGVSGILLASDEDILEAMRLIWTRLKQVVEPSAAIVLAAIALNPSIFSGKRVVVVLSGGNVDLDPLPFGRQ